MKKIYIAAYHQSRFGKLMDMSVPAIIQNAIEGVCDEIDAEPAALDVGSIGAACNFSLNEQGLLAGLMAMTPGLEGKPIEAVENACASGGQAVLSVIYKLLLGLGETGIAVGYEKMRDAQGKMDGPLIGKVLGYFSYPGRARRQDICLPAYLRGDHALLSIRASGDGRGLGAYRGAGICQRARQPMGADAQCAAHGGETRCEIEGINRYVVEGLPLKTYDCSQITDGYAALILATEEGLRKLGVAKGDCVEIAGWRAGNRSAGSRGARRAAPSRCAKGDGQSLRDGRHRALAK